MILFGEVMFLMTPDDKVFSDSSRVALSVFPNIGVGKIFLFSETLLYRLLQLTNLTLNVIASVCQELTAICLMVL